MKLDLDRKIVVLNSRLESEHIAHIKVRIMTFLCTHTCLCIMYTYIYKPYTVYVIRLFIYLHTCIYYRSARSLRIDTSMPWATNWTGTTDSSDTPYVYLYICRCYKLCNAYIYTDTHTLYTHIYIYIRYIRPIMCIHHACLSYT